MKRTADAGRIDIRAVAEVRNGDAVVTVASSGVGVRADGAASLREMEDAQVSELRRTLYGMGFSKRAIATACKDVGRDMGRDD